MIHKIIFSKDLIGGGGQTPQFIPINSLLQSIIKYVLIPLGLLVLAIPSFASHTVNCTTNTATMAEVDNDNSADDTGILCNFSNGTDGTLTVSIKGTLRNKFEFDDESAGTGRKLQLKADQSLDYETEGDVDGSNKVITLTIEVSSGSETAGSDEVEITLTDFDEAPEVTSDGSQNTLNEDHSSTTAVDTGIDISTNDEDATGTASAPVIATTGDSAKFQISATGDLQIKANQTFDHEMKDTYTITITTSSTNTGGSATEKKGTLFVTISVTDLDEAPTVTPSGSQTNNLNENVAASATPIDTGYTFTTNDEDENVTASAPAIASGGDNANFQLSSDTPPKLQVKPNVTFDHEAQDAYTITITTSSTNTGGNEKKGTVFVTLTIGDVNEPPWVEISGTFALDEGSHTRTNTGLVVRFRNDANQNNGNAFGDLISGGDSGNFTLDRVNGNLIVNGTRTFDYETKSTYVLHFQTADRLVGRTEFANRILTISVKNTDEGPEISHGTGETQVVLAENITFSQPTDTGFTYTANDPDATGGTPSAIVITTTGDSANFQLSNDTPKKLQVKQGVIFDYEDKRTYTITLNSTSTNTDAGATAQTGTSAFIINVGNVDEAPIVSHSGTQAEVLEGSYTAVFDTGIDIVVIETEGAVEFTYSGDSSKFEVASDGDLEVKTGSTFDYEMKASYTITITATESTTGNTSTGPRESDSEVVTVFISDRDESPTLNVLNFPVASTNSFYSFKVPQTAYLDPERRRVIYTDKSNSSWLSFNPFTETYYGLAPASATVIEVSLSVSTPAPYTAGTIYTHNLTILANKAPILSINGSQNVVINENASRNNPLAFAFTITAKDPDGRVASTVASDPAFSFNSSGVLVMAASKRFNYEENNFYTLTITARDNVGAITSKKLTLSITDVNEAPTLVTSGFTVEVMQGATVNVAIDRLVSDPEDRNLVVSSLTPNWVTFDAVSQNLVVEAPLTPESLTMALQDVTFSAGDGTLNVSGSPSFKVTVVSDGLIATCTDCFGITTAQTAFLENIHTAIQPTIYNSYIQVTITTATRTNPSISFVYAGPDKNYFVPISIDSSGSVTVLFKAGFNYDFERKSVFTISIDAVQSGRVIGSQGREFTLSNVHEYPLVSVFGTQTKIEDDSYSTKHFTGYTIDISDPDENNQDISITVNNDNFLVINSSIFIKASLSLDASMATTRLQTLIISSADKTVKTFVPAATLLISVQERNYPPSVRVSGVQTPINEGNYTVDFTTHIDVNATDVNYDSIAIGIDNDKFKLNDAGDLIIKAGSSFDYETASDRLHVVRVNFYDGINNPVTEILNIRVANVNEPPSITRTGSQVSLVEGTFNAVTDTGYTFSASDPEGDTRTTFSTTPNTHFQIASDGKLQIKQGASFDYETVAQRNYQVMINATDSDNNTSTSVVTIRFNNIEEGPAFEQSGTSTLPESTNATGYQNDTFTGINLRVFEPEGTSLTIVYSDDKFFVDHNQRRLMVKASTFLDYENPAHRLFTLTITASSNNDTNTHTVTISVNNVYEDLTLISMTTSIYVDNSQDLSIALSDHVIVDAASNSNIVYTLLSTSHSWVSKNSDNVLVGTPPLVNESQTITLSISVTHTAGSNNSTATIVLPIVINPKDYEEISQAVLPDVFDVVIAQGTGAVVNRIAKLNEEGALNTFDTELVAALRNNVDMINNNEINIYQILKGREYALGFHDGDYSNTDFGVWARFNFDVMDGTATNLEFDGNVFGFSAGVDRQFVNGGILGVALSHSTGEIDFTQTINNRKVEGVYDLNLSTVQPYFSNSFQVQGRGEINYWLSFGLGTGDVDITETGSSIVTTNDLGLVTYAMGLDTSIYEINERSSVKLFAKMQLSQLSVEDKAVNRADRDYDNRLLKAGVSYDNDITFRNNVNVNAKVGLALVNRNTQGLTDVSSSGYELFTQMEFRSHVMPLLVSGDLSYQSVSDLSQISGGLELSYRNSRSRLGYFMDIEPAYRSKESFNIFDLASNNDKGFGESNLLLSSELGYGFGVIGGVLTPYGDYRIKHDLEEYGLGIRYNQADKLTWSLGVNTENDKAQETKFGIEYKIIN